jgi:RND superfamily putative drug exporter
MTRAGHPALVSVAGAGPHAPFTPSLRTNGRQKGEQAVAQRVKTFPYTTGVSVGGVGREGHTTYLLVNFNRDADYVHQRLAAFRALLPSGAAAAPAPVRLTGDTAVYDEFNRLGQQAAEQADMTALPIALILLLVIFGTVVAALTPLVLAVISPSICEGSMTFTGVPEASRRRACRSR